MSLGEKFYAAAVCVVISLSAIGSYTVFRWCQNASTYFGESQEQRRLEQEQQRLANEEQERALAEERRIETLKAEFKQANKPEDKVICLAALAFFDKSAGDFRQIESDGTVTTDKFMCHVQDDGRIEWRYIDGRWRTNKLDEGLIYAFEPYQRSLVIKACETRESFKCRTKTLSY
ncbi:hypothetical protein RCJ22_15530 [Vibrio sp. FNV 38]|nr:hypothetical protein [Vibrio sp. FNV 38]